jgi:imidazoleglycerol-phosphate dehydratase
VREAHIERKTGETDIRLTLNLDGAGRFSGTSGIGFFDHMLNLLSVHGGLDLSLQARGDLEVDNHHTVEDIGIALGQALNRALGDKKGIARYGCFFCPMDEALSRIVIDLSGRSYLVYDVSIPVERIGSFETEMTREFFLALAQNGCMNLHMACLYGINGHHIVESLFKGTGHALAQAVSLNSQEKRILSTKGVL